MKLSENTVEVIKNFATINTGIVVKPGKLLRTISSNKAILAAAEIDEEFDEEFGIYDLNKLLGLLSLNKSDPIVELGKEYLQFSGLSNSAKIRMRFTSPNLIVTPPAKNISITDYEINFKLTQTVLDWIFNVASILKCPNIVVKGKDGKITIWAMDVKGEIVDDASVDVDGNSGDIEFEAVIEIENLKVISGDYDVEISVQGISKFTHKTKKLTYWIALKQGASKFVK